MLESDLHPFAADARDDCFPPAVQEKTSTSSACRFSRGGTQHALPPAHERCCTDQGQWSDVTDSPRQVLSRKREHPPPEKSRHRGDFVFLPEHFHPRASCNSSTKRSANKASQNPRLTPCRHLCAAGHIFLFDAAGEVHVLREPFRFAGLRDRTLTSKKLLLPIAFTLALQARSASRLLRQSAGLQGRATGLAGVTANRHFCLRR